MFARALCQLVIALSVIATLMLQRGIASCQITTTSGAYSSSSLANVYVRMQTSKTGTVSVMPHIHVCTDGVCVSVMRTNPLCQVTLTVDLPK